MSKSLIADFGQSESGRIDHVTGNCCRPIAALHIHVRARFFKPPANGSAASPIYVTFLCNKLPMPRNRALIAS